MSMRPNIVLINCDDLGYGDLGCYGSTVNDTPSIDALCENGLKLTDFYMASPVCSPSRGGMLTGCYPPRIGFGDFDGKGVLFPGQGIGLEAGEKTIAQMLKERDYSTMLIGKWHCGDQRAFLPLHFGFDRYYGLPYSNDMGRQGERADYPPLPLMEGDEVIQEQPEQRSLTERYTEQAVKFIRKNKQGPFFLYFAHMHTHLPHYAQARFERESRNGEYGASVGEIDWSVEVITKELARLGLSQNTLIIFTSDNGSNMRYGGSNGPLRGIKGYTWEGGIRVPCIWSWAGRIRPGVSSEIVSSIDFFATLASIVGGKLPERTIDSLDVSEAIFREGDGRSPRDTFFYYFRNGLEAVRRGPWKLKVLDRDTPMRVLYNLVEDIGEREDLCGHHPEIVRELEALLQACAKDIGDSFRGVVGENVRAAGRVANPETLTHYDENHPYIMAMYDKDQAG